MYLLFTPWGLASLIGLILPHNIGEDYLMIILLILEITLVILGKYPKVIKLGIDDRIGAFIFYLALNFISSMAVFLTAFGNLSI